MEKFHNQTTIYFPDAKLITETQNLLELGHLSHLQFLHWVTWDKTYSLFLVQVAEEIIFKL